MMCFGASDDDNTYRTNETFWNQLDHVDASRKQWVVLYDDHHGEEELIADHNWMTDYGRIPDNYLRYGAWRWTLAIANDTFYGKDRDKWYGGTDAQTNMGKWSDGTPVRPAAVTSGELFWEDPFADSKPDQKSHNKFRSFMKMRGNDKEGPLQNESLICPLSSRQVKYLK